MHQPLMNGTEGQSYLGKCLSVLDIPLSLDELGQG
jgi:hypothetical protein